MSQGLMHIKPSLYMLVLTQLIRDGPKPKKRSLSKIKGHSRESKAFSKSIKSNNPGTLCCVAYWMMPSISLIFSPMNRPFIKPV